MHVEKRVLMAVVILLLLLGPIAAGPAGADGMWTRYIRRETNPPGNWVPVQWIIKATWCDNSGQCGTQWSPERQEAIFERVPDRVWLGHGIGDDSPPYPPVGRWPRLLCVDGRWAEGTWYHNATFEGSWAEVDRYTSYENSECRGDTPCIIVVYEERWSMLRDYSNFAPEDDNCNDPDPGGGGGGGGGGGNPTPGPTPPWRPTDRPDPTPPPTDRPVLPLPDPWSEENTYPPSIEMGYFPPYPVIVGQDPVGGGVTLSFTVTTWPVETIYHWYTCQHPPGQPDMCYVGTIVEHTEVVYTPDPPDLEQTAGWMKLTETSKSWVGNVLGPKFGVKVQHPDWDIAPADLAWKVTGPWEDHTYRSCGSAGIPAEDPGWYQVDLFVTTEYGVVGHFAIPLPLVAVTGFGVTLIR